MAKATPQARLAASRRKAERREDRRHQRAAKQPGFLQDSGSERHGGPMCARMLSRGVSDQSNWRMDQCAIHMDGARTMLHQL
jgi:hypothetical protein